MAPESDQFDPLPILSARFRAAIAAAYPDAGEDIDPAISASRRAELGDFQCNAAMALSKRVGVAPREIASNLIKHVRADDLLLPLDASAIAGPGFINLRLRPDALAGLLTSLDTPALGVAVPDNPSTIVVDLVGVNLAKQMHVGHLRSMIIGDAVARTFERLGATVIRQNHVGDWGLPIAMVTHRVMRGAVRGDLKLDDLTLDDLDALYREAQAECSADHRGLAAVRRFGLGPKAEAELQAQVSGAEQALADAKRTLTRLQGQDPEVVRVWQRIADITMGECLEVCRKLGVAVDRSASAGESSYAGELAGVVEDLLERGVATVDDGAVVVRVEGFGQPCLIRKGDGGFLYATTDLAAIRRRVQKLGADRVVYCVDARQSLHFELAFAATRVAGYATKPGADGPSRLQHAAFGMVLGEDHRPFKTRSGENVKLSALIDEALRRAAAIVAAKNPQMSEVEREPIARSVAIAAIKYADLSSDRVKDYVFSFDRMLAFEGNTGPYLLYAVVRIRSIFRKAADRGVDRTDGALTLEHPAERQLALTLLRYPGVLQSAGDSLEPHRLCAFLFELATAFSAFFDACPVLGAASGDLRDSRLRLCHMTDRVLTDGLTVLGISALDRM
ncbi:MAG: arginine--tRNA ligase [Phycisphaeraceae bacterium]|nr:arginine--tRNA ligase [Phycisphaeraceae bacterium]